MGLFSGSHLMVLLIAFIVLMMFGNRLPNVMRSLGQGIVEFKKGLHGIEDDVKSADAPPKKIEEQPAEKQQQS